VAEHDVLPDVPDRVSSADAIALRDALDQHKGMVPVGTLARTKVGLAWVSFAQVVGTFASVVLGPALGFGLAGETWWGLVGMLVIWVGGFVGSLVGGNAVKARLYAHALRAARPSLTGGQGGATSSAVPLLRD